MPARAIAASRAISGLGASMRLGMVSGWEVEGRRGNSADGWPRFRGRPANRMLEGVASPPSREAQPPNQQHHSSVVATIIALSLTEFTDGLSVRF